MVTRWDRINKINRMGKMRASGVIPIKLSPKSKVREGASTGEVPGRKGALRAIPKRSRACAVQREAESEDLLAYFR